MAEKTTTEETTGKSTDTTDKIENTVTESSNKKVGVRPQMGLFKKILNPSVIFSKSSDNPYVIEGNLFLKKLKLDDALDAFQAAIEADKQCIEAYLGLGKTLSMMGGMENTKKSLIPFNNALKLDPTRLDIYNDTINIYERLGDKRNAAAERKKRFIAKTLKSNPNDSKANNNMGVMQLQQKNIRAAIKSFQKAITINKNFFTAKLNLATAYLHEARSLVNETDKTPFLKQAINLVDQVIMNANSAEANLLKAKIYLEGKNPKAASTACNAAISMDPSLKEAYNTKRVIEELQGNIGNASQAYENYQSIARQEQKKVNKKIKSPFE